MRIGIRKRDACQLLASELTPTFNRVYILFGTLKREDTYAKEYQR